MKLWLALLLVASPAMAWSQTDGDAHRSGTLALADGPLDVVAVLDVYDACQEEALAITGGVFFAVGDHGFVTVTAPMDDSCLPLSGSCDMLYVEDWRAPEVHRVPLTACGGAMINGVFEWQGRNHLLVSSHLSARESGLTAYDIRGDGTPVWQLSPAEVARAPGEPPAVERGTYTCWDPAIDHANERIFAACYYSMQGQDAFANVVMEVGFDGSVAWARSLPPLTAYAAPHQDVFEPLSPVPVPGAYLAPVAVALGETGLFISGFTYCPDPRCGLPTPEAGHDPDGHIVPTEARGFHGVLAWTDLEGRFQGAYSPLTETARADPLATEEGMFARAPLALGDTGFAALGGRLIHARINSAAHDAQPVMGRGESSFQGALSVPSAVTDGRFVFAAGYQAVFAFQGTTAMPAWDGHSLQAGDGWWKPTMAVDRAQGRLLAVFHRGMGDIGAVDAGEMWMREGVALVADAATGRAMQRIPIPLQDTMHTHPYVMPIEGDQGIVDWDVGVKIGSLDDGHVLLSTGLGKFVVLGPAATQRLGSLQVDDAYPAPGREVTVTLQGADIQDLHVAWGDGFTEDVPQNAGTLRKTFTAPGQHVIAVTAAFDDNTTETRTAIVYVGGQPPPDLNLFQRAFAPENQDLTFGVLGIALAVLGTLLGVLVRMRSRSQLRLALARIDQARQIARTDPFAGLEMARQLRDEFHDKLLAGRITEDQHRVMIASADALLHKLARMRLAEPLQKCTQKFHDLLWGILNDSVVTVAEMETVLAAAKREKGLDDAGRREVEDVLRAWVA